MAVHSRLTKAENGWAKSKAEADRLRAQTAAGLVDTDEDQVTRGLMWNMEAEMASLRGNEKRIEAIQYRNEPWRGWVFQLDYPVPNVTLTLKRIANFSD